MLPRAIQAIKTAMAITRSATKLALVVRGDLRMSKGKTAAQCAHAAVLCYQRAQESQHRKHRELLESWSLTGQPKIVLRVDAYEDIEKLMQAAKQSNVIAAVVKDAGRTQLEPGTATVLGIGPDAVERIDKLVAHLKLL